MNQICHYEQWNVSAHCTYSEKKTSKHIFEWVELIDLQNEHNNEIDLQKLQMVQSQIHTRQSQWN